VVWAPRCRDSVMGRCEVWLFFADLSFLVNSQFGHSRAWHPACSHTGALLHCCFPWNLSTTTQGAIIQLRGTFSEWCTLLCLSLWNSKTALAAVCELFWDMLEREVGGLMGIISGLSGSGYNEEVLALEVLNVVDCVE